MRAVIHCGAMGMMVRWVRCTPFTCEKGGAGKENAEQVVVMPQTSRVWAEAWFGALSTMHSRQR